MRAYAGGPLELSGSHFQGLYSCVAPELKTTTSVHGIIIPKYCLFTGLPTELASLNKIILITSKFCSKVGHHMLFVEPYHI